MRHHACARTEEFDVLIVGAGPAGCIAAADLGKKMRVLLVDSSPLPRGKPCGGALNHYSWTFLRDLGPPKRLFVDPEEVRFRWVDFDSRISRVTRLEFKNVSRDAFDEWLLSLVPDRVQVWGETRLRSYEANCARTNARLVVDGDEVIVSARHVIGADGALSQVRRQVSTADCPTYSCIQDWVERSGVMPPYFDCLRLKGVGEGHAYTYVVPKGEAVLVGSVFYPGATAQKAKHDEVLARLREGLGFGGSIKREAAAALQVRSGRDVLLGDGNVLLTGEAAGFISPTSGEGISYALSTGRMCAQAIAAEPNDALGAYRKLATPVVRNIAAKTRKLALLESRLGHAVLATMPLPLLSWLTMRL